MAKFERVMCIKIDEEFFNEISNASRELKISKSALVRMALYRYLHGGNDGGRRDSK